MRHIYLVLSAVFVSSCVSAPPRRPAGDPGSAIHIISTTDLHGYILPQKDMNNQPYGGIEAMSGLFQIAREADPDTLLLDSGDLFQGTIISNATEGSTVITWMNYAGYTAAAVGNHDFDFGPGGGDSHVVRAGQDPLGALKARIAQAKFPMLSANICAIDEDAKHCEDSHDYAVAKFTRPYIIKEIRGIKVGIIGLTTTTTPQTTFAGNVQRLKFLPMGDALEKFVPQMIAEGAETVIAVMHEGAACDKGVCDAKERMTQAIDALSPEVRRSIPLFLAGHTHNFVDTVYNGVHVMINGSYGRTFGYLTLERTANGFAVTQTKSVEVCTDIYTATNACRTGKGERVPMKFLDQQVKADAKATELIAPDIQKANAKSGEVLGKLATEVNAVFGATESTLGDFVTDALRLCVNAACAGPAADVAFQNGTGLRVKRIAAGNVTYGEIFELLPFDNAVATVQMTGSQIHDLIDIFYNYNHSNMNDVSGIKINFTAVPSHNRTVRNAKGESKDYPDAVDSIAFADGTAFDENKTYRVVMADYLAEGGGGSTFFFDGFTPEPKIQQERQLRDAISDYLKAHPEGLDYSQLGGGRLLRSGGAPN